MLFLTITLLGSAINAPGPPPPPPPAPPCTLEMLKARPAGDKNWPIKCSGATLGEPWEDSGRYKGEYKALELSGYNMAYGEFVGTTFIGEGAVNFAGSNLHHANLSGAKFTARLRNGKALINFTAANLTNADLSGSEIAAEGSYYSDTSTIDFTKATLAKADLSGSELTAGGYYYYGAAFYAFYGGVINFIGANLNNANIYYSKLTAGSIVGLAPALPPPPPPPPSAPPLPSPNPSPPLPAPPTPPPPLPPSPPPPPPPTSPPLPSQPPPSFPPVVPAATAAATATAATRNLTVDEPFNNAADSSDIGRTIGIGIGALNAVTVFVVFLWAGAMLVHRRQQRALGRATKSMKKVATVHPLPVSRSVV